jgi:hypothetical protein
MSDWIMWACSLVTMLLGMWAGLRYDAWKARYRKWRATRKRWYSVSLMYNQANSKMTGRWFSKLTTDGEWSGFVVRPPRGKRWRGVIDSKRARK